MPLKNPFKLEKLQIKAYNSRNRTGNPTGTFEAMFNPASFKERYEIRYGKGQGINSSRKVVVYARSEPSQLMLRLILDGTGVDEIGLTALGSRKTVQERIKEFVDLTFRMNGAIHEPNYLVVKWGDLNFWCRLQSVEIEYTSFERDGTARRAELEVSLIRDTTPKMRTLLENKSSPDLTHRRIVRQGETLPLLTKEIYGSSKYYLSVAQASKLDNFRNLTPGQELIFPVLPGLGGSFGTKN
jgi:Contractile injection system tube protein